jgi:hypothetical protein
MNKDRLTFRSGLNYILNVFLVVLTVYLFVQFSNQIKSQRYENSIKNPENQPFVLECAFNLGIPIDSVTQEQFNERYLK